MTYVLWFIIVFSILALGYGYVGWRFTHATGLTPPWRTRVWVSLVACFIIPVGTFLLEVNKVESAWLDRMSWIAFPVLGLFSLIITILLIRDLLWLISSGVKKLVFPSRDFLSSHASDHHSTDPRRRQFLLQTGNVAILGIAGTLTGYGLFEARRRPAIVEIPVFFPHLPDDLDGFRIIQITDIHAGLTVKRGFVQTVVSLANALAPDLVAFTGDLADGSVPYLRDDVSPLTELSARHGRFFVTGNHEYYSGAEPWVEEVDRLGFTVLLNEHRVVRRGAGRILLAGVTDYSAGQFIPTHASNPAAALSGAPSCDVRILLAHQPRSLYAAAPLGFDLQISGHTHGGQFFPWNLAATVAQPYISGLHKHKDTWIYVSRGTGYWGPPIRLAARSEITVITLRKAA